MATHIITHNKTLDILFAEIKTELELAELIRKTPFLISYIDYSVNDNMNAFDIIDDVEVKRENFHVSQAGAYLINRGTHTTIVSAILNPKATKNLRRKQYLVLCSMLCYGESMIFEAILKKNLASIYPKFTHEFLSNTLNIVNGNTNTQ